MVVKKYAPHLMEIRPDVWAPVTVIHKGRRMATVEYQGQRFEVRSRKLKKIHPDHILPS